MAFMLRPLNFDGANNYTINHKVPFGKNNYRFNLSGEDLQACFEFCSKMTYGGDGTHRVHRSGGSDRRGLDQIFKDAFIGKVGEIAFHKMCLQRQKGQVSDIDYDCYGSGLWDESDFTITASDGQVSKVAVKTTKHFGNLLLLETKDWQVKDNRAIYLPNADTGGVYDFIMFCRVNTNIDDVSRQFKLGDTSTHSSALERLTAISEVVGYIKNADLVSCIEHPQIIPKGAKLNGSITMDAENYYIQSGSFRAIPQIDK